MDKANLSGKVGNYRWIIVTLLLFSTTINYMDRNVIGFLKDYFCSANGFNWTSEEFSYLTSAFTLFYALSTLFVGAIIDKIGTKIGLALSLIVWSFTGIMSAFVGKSVWAQSIIRSFFSVGEAGNFPSSVKTVAEWFPIKERALATGIFNSGSNIGAMICALFVPWTLVLWGKGHEFFGVFAGWQMAFIITGIIGLFWLIFWFKSYNTPKKTLELGKISQAEYDYIHSDKEEAINVKEEEEDKAEKIPWGKMLTYRQTWSFLFGKFMTDGIWWFLLFWLPTYVKQQFTAGLSVDETAFYVMMSNFIVFGVAIVGSIYGGAIPLKFMNKGWGTYKARMTAMFIIACAPLVLLATQPLANSFGIVVAIGMVCIAAAAHQAWSANLFTTVSDMFPKKTVATIIGIGTTAGGIGGVLLQLLAGHLDGTYSTNTAYGVMFTVCAFAYLIAWGVMKMLVPRHSPITDL